MNEASDILIAMGVDTTTAPLLLCAVPLFAIVILLCMASLGAAVQSKSRIGILLLKLFEDLRTNLVDLCLGDSSKRQTRHDLLKQPLDNTKTPLTHNERFRDIDSSDRNGHKLRLVIGGWGELSCRNWPSMRISFPQIARNEVGYEPKKETTNNSQNEITEAEIPLGLKLWPPSQILTSRALDDSAKSDIGNINALPALGTVEVIPDSLSDANGCAINKFRKHGIGHDS